MKPYKNMLFRKVNTLAIGVRHNTGNNYRNNRGKESAFGMRQGIQRGLDYTPLFKFLLSKVGQKWDLIYSNAISRLDNKEPLFWMVSLNYDTANEVVRLGESSYYSGLFVDDNGILKKVNPDITEHSLEPKCPCCTHTFNGKPYTKKYELAQ